MLNRFSVGLLAAIVFVGAGQTASADCWYFKYKQNGAGPYSLGPYASRSAAISAFYKLFQAEHRAGRRIDYVSRSLKDYCARKPPRTSKATFTVYRRSGWRWTKVGRVCGSEKYVAARRSMYCDVSSYYGCSKTRRVSRCS